MLTEKFAVSVIVPTYNRSQNLEYTIKSLAGQNIDKAAFEIIIADDGSSDDTFQMVKRYQDQVNIKYAYQTDEGYRTASARNMGIKIAEGNICLFIDSGIIVKSDCLEQHIACHGSRKNEIAIIGYTYGYTQNGQTEEELISLIDPADADGSIATLAEKGRFTDIRERIYRKYNDRLDMLRVPWTLFWGGHLSVKRKTLLEVGLFDENYDGNWGCEDNDLGLRLLVADRKIVFCREAAVLHLPHGTNTVLKAKEGYINCKYFHDKFQTLETEIFLEYYLKEISGQLTDHEVIDFEGIVTDSRKTVNA